MAQTYHQLQYDERRQIHALHQQEASARTIAAQLRRHRSTIYRELRHSSNPNPSGYATARPRPAPKSAAGKPSPDPHVPPPWNRICKMLRMEGSPEQIAGCLQRSGEVSGSCSWLYWCIHQDRADGAQLHTCLFLNSAFAACSSSSPVALRCAMGVPKNGTARRCLQYWVIPTKADGEYAAAVENVLSTYEEPYDEQRPAVCRDERPVQMVQETRQPLPATTEHPRRVDDEYQQAGVASVFGLCEPLAAWRTVAALLESRSANCEKITQVPDNLNTHTRETLYEAFDPERAQRLRQRIKFQHTPNTRVG